MSCEQFEDDVVDLARDEEIEDGRRDAARAHAEGCLRCAERLEEERAVTSALRSLATRTAGAEAPPRVEAALRRAMREPGAAAGAGPGRTSPSRGIELLLLAAAAAILAAIVVVPPRLEPRRDPSPATIPVGSPSLASAVEAGENAEFVSLRYGEEMSDLDSVQVVSVELPPTALAALGWPSDGVAPAGPVRAELIVGHDGVARAIRFVE